MDFCTRCGRQLSGGTQFCTGCGARLRPPDTPAPEPQGRPETPGYPPPHEYPQPPIRPRAARDGDPPKWVLIVAAVLVLGICGAATAIIVLRSSPANHATLSSNRSPTSPSPVSPRQPTTQPPTQPSTTQPAAEQVAAQSLSQLLAQSATDRSAIVDAVNDVNACGANLSQDATTFQQAAESRQQLLSQLASLPDSSALPAQLIQDLTGAWQSSQQADQDFAGWADDENSNGCTADDSSDSNYQAATAPDNQATADKQAFVSLWNPIAGQYGLPTYAWNQL